MIYTVTLNPSLDYNMSLGTLDFGKTNRTNDEYIVPGGKGLNISIILSRLECPTTALGFCGGFTGAELERLLKKENIYCDFTKVADSTRINVKLNTGEITEFNASGISIDEHKINALKLKLSTLKPGDWLCLSGSIPKGAQESIYKDLADSAPKDVFKIIDTTGKTLTTSLSSNPFLIKPNKDELCDIFNTEINTTEEIIFYAKKLQTMGAQNVLVSLGGDGALLIDNNGNTYFQDAPKGTVINTVAAGDSMIAGFIKQYIETENYQDALKFAVSTGSATAFSKWLATPILIKNLYETL